MSNKLRDLRGRRFGRLVVLHRKLDEKTNTRWKCLCDCGKLTVAVSQNLQSGRHRSCGCGRKGRTAFKAKELTYQAGYAFAHAAEHPRANPHTGRVREHILVMEEKIGRRLLPLEEVHHKNGVRSDNRPDNLELWTCSQPAGKRATDAVMWAKEILRLYEPGSLTTL